MRSCTSGRTLNAGIDIRVTPQEVPEQSASHNGLLDSSYRASSHDRFGAIVVPSRRPAEWLSDCMQLAKETRIPLVVICSKQVRKDEVIEMARKDSVEAYALDLPPYPFNPLGITFKTSSDPGLADASSVTTRDLSTKRNLGLVLGRMLGWKRLMFLDDDIYGISTGDVDSLAAALSDHNVSALIPDQYPDNSVACHANRLGGGEQGKFASACSMGVRCYRDDLAFFPNIYNEDWFFFSDEAANHKIIKVGESKQRPYDPYEDPGRAVKEEFGDLLAEGLYARLDHKQGLYDTGIAYWTGFIEQRRAFHAHVARSLRDHQARYDDTRTGRDIRAAEISIYAAQEQLKEISPELCHRFVEIWKADLREWQSYLTKLDRFDSIVSAFKYLKLDCEESFPSSTR